MTILIKFKTNLNMHTQRLQHNHGSQISLLAKFTVAKCFV